MKLHWPFPIYSRLKSSAAIVFGQPVFGSNSSWFIKKSHTAFCKLQDARYWFKYRFNRRYQYHIVRTDLEPGYYDVDTIMLHACMTLLRRHVEDTYGGVGKLDEFTKELREPGSEGHGPREVVDRQADNQSEVATIYRWWTIERPRDQKRRDILMHRLYGKRNLTTKPSEHHPRLHEIVFDKFTDSELVLEEEFRKLENKINDDEDKMLHRLMDIRHSLWD